MNLARFIVRPHQGPDSNPSWRKIRGSGQNAHPISNIIWVSDKLPELNRISEGQFDVIILSAVWMHIHPSDREAAFDRLSSLVSKDGIIYFTLRRGPAEQERAIWPVDGSELEKMARRFGFNVVNMGTKPDLIGRKEVFWETIVISKNK